MLYNALLAGAAMIAGATAAAVTKPAGSAASVPKTEKFTIHHFGFHMARDYKTVTNLNFNGTASLATTPMYCSEDHAEFPDPKQSTPCDNPEYSFAVHFPPGDGVNVRIYHKTECGNEYWGQARVTIGCYSTGDCFGIKDERFEDYANVTTTLHLGTPPAFP